MAWIAEHLNVLITGPCGVGESFFAGALAHAACRADHSVRCFRLSRLADELARYRAINNRSSFLKRLAKADLLVLDDFGLAPMSEDVKRYAGKLTLYRLGRCSTALAESVDLATSGLVQVRM